MGWLEGIINGISGIAQQYNQNKFNQREAEKQRDWSANEAALQRDWSANEAALQRDWSSQEAERARDWQEEMNAKYNSLPGKIAQAEQAGVNPMFAVTGNAVSPVSASTSAPSGASASGASASGAAASSTSQFVDIVGAILNARKTQAEIDLMNKQSDKTDAETQQILKDTSWIDQLNIMSMDEARQRIEQSVAEIANSNADTQLKTAEIGRVAADIANTNADTDTKIKQLDVMTSEIIKNAKSLDVMDAQISELLSSVNVNNKQVVEIKHRVNAMKLEYGHRAVMNALEEMVAKADATDANYKNPANYTGVAREARQLLNEIKEVISFGFTNK